MTDESKHPEMGGADNHATRQRRIDPGLVAQSAEP